MFGMTNHNVICTQFCSYSISISSEKFGSTGTYWNRKNRDHNQLESVGVNALTSTHHYF